MQVLQDVHIKSLSDIITPLSTYMQTHVDVINIAAYGCRVQRGRVRTKGVATLGVRVYVYVCTCMCVRERERERESVRLCVRSPGYVSILHIDSKNRCQTRERDAEEVGWSVQLQCGHDIDNLNYKGMDTIIKPTSSYTNINMTSFTQVHVHKHSWVQFKYVLTRTMMHRSHNGC